MDNLKFHTQHGFGNRKIEFMERYDGIHKGAVVDGTSVPKKAIFFVSFLVFYLAHIGVFHTWLLFMLPLVTFLVILPESNGLFFIAGAKHDVKYQSARVISGKFTADYEFYKDMLTACTQDGCSKYTKIVGVCRATIFYIGVFLGGWGIYSSYISTNQDKQIQPR